MYREAQLSKRKKPYAPREKVGVGVMGVGVAWRRGGCGGMVGGFLVVLCLSCVGRGRDIAIFLLLVLVLFVICLGGPIGEM